MSSALEIYPAISPNNIPTLRNKKLIINDIVSIKQSVTMKRASLYFETEKNRKKDGIETQIYEAIADGIPNT